MFGRFWQQVLGVRMFSLVTDFDMQTCPLNFYQIILRFGWDFYHHPHVPLSGYR